MLPGLLGPALLLAFTLAPGSPARADARGARWPRAAICSRSSRTGLTAAPACAPHCAEIVAARVVVEGDRLEVILQVSALANVAVAMPHASDRWQLDEVSVDSRSVARDGSRR